MSDAHSTPGRPRLRFSQIRGVSKEKWLAAVAIAVAASFLIYFVFSSM
jgi:hypothetical protein